MTFTRSFQTKIFFLTLSASICCGHFLSAQKNPENPTDPATADCLKFHHYFGKTTFLDLSTIINGLVVNKILDNPPVPGSADALKDEAERETVYNNATEDQVWAAVRSEDDVFAYSHTLGDHFNAVELPKTNALFQKVDDDARLAIFVAKNIFQRRRPMNNSGFCYPSGHTTRAFIWATLLSSIFPQDQDAFMVQAQAKGWNRVILGRHYPKDIEAGKAYGIYLTQQFLDDPSFQHQWKEVVTEITSIIK